MTTSQITNPAAAPKKSLKRKLSELLLRRNATGNGAKTTSAMNSNSGYFQMRPSRDDSRGVAGQHAGRAGCRARQKPRHADFADGAFVWLITKHQELLLLHHQQRKRARLHGAPRTRLPFC